MYVCMNVYIYIYICYNHSRGNIILGYVQKECFLFCPCVQLFLFLLCCPYVQKDCFSADTGMIPMLVRLHTIVTHVLPYAPEPYSPETVLFQVPSTVFKGFLEIHTSTYNTYI